MFREPKCGECVGELMECFGSLWNVSGACGMFRKLVEYFGELVECCREKNRLENHLAAYRNGFGGYMPEIILFATIW